MMAETKHSREPEIVVVGVAAMDMVAQVETLPHPDDLTLARQFRISPGGSGANVAAALSRLGCSVGFLGRVGDDEYGHQLIQSFKDAGVDTSAIIIDRALPTPTCFVALDDNGDRIIIALGNAAILDKAADLSLPYIRNAKALYLSDVDGEVVSVAAREAHIGGATVFYGPGGMITARGAANLAPLLKDVDALIISRAEAQKLAPGAAPDIVARKLAQMGAPLVVQTLGAEGVLLASRNDVIRVPAFPVQTIVDTTGAGDAFAAGMIAAHIEGQGWENAAAFGCMIASIKINHIGARAGIPTRKEATAWLTKLAVRNNA